MRLSGANGSVLNGTGTGGYNTSATVLISPGAALVLDNAAANNNNRPMYYSQIRVDPTNPEIVYTMGAPFFKSTDGGQTFRQVQGIAHSDHHALWIDPKNPNHLILGNDGGLDVSYDQGETWEFVNTIPAGQFYAVSADMRKPYYVCGGLQDNGSWCGPSAVRSQTGILNEDWL